MDLRGVLRRKGVCVSRKAGKKITEYFREFLKARASGTVPAWPLDSLQGILNTEVSSLTELSLGLQYLCEKNSIVKGEMSQADSSIKNFNTIVNPVLKNHHSSLVVTYDLPHVLGNISKMCQGEDKKYCVWNDSLDYKIEICKDICDMSQCPTDRRMDGFILALEEPALSEFRAHRHKIGMIFEVMVEHLRKCYEGMDYKRSEV
ncbi:hypothetical protein GcM1_210025 [Golovinomyces cichoracearum]|uniref:Uncharacterized protein n=1 Tax=Golovinomyces cichoracearum TaxID=62708 RepID=A0A420IVH9_9PEZI|nr:hypothetical protein GcM1_210025 [Golovinomyces cichoracearum]